MAHKVLSPSDLAASLEHLAGWASIDGKIAKTFEFENFIEAFGWMAQVALHAEKLDHHPEWFNVYRTVKVELQTHDAGPAVTDLDVKLARIMNTLAGH